MATNKNKWIPSAPTYPLLIKDLLRFPLVFSEDREIVYRDRVRYSYRLFNERIEKLAGLLMRLGVEPGDSVAVLDWNSHRYLECYFAVPMMGAVLHPVNMRLSPDQIVYTITHAEDAVIIINGDFLPLLQGVRDHLPADKKIILANDSVVPPSLDLSVFGEYEDLLSTSDDRFLFPDFTENTVATVFYTTGAGGRPKNVCITHRQLMLHTFGLISGLSGYKSQFTVRSDDVYMPMTPMCYVHAYGVPYMMTALGAKQVYPGRFDAEILLKLFDSEKVSFSHCGPTDLYTMLESPLIGETDVTGWKMIVGGSSLSRGLCGSALEKGINLVTGYGLSETCPVMTLALLKPHMMDRSMEEQIEVRCRTGIPTPMVQIEIVDPVGSPLPHDGLSVGEVVVRSPWLTQENHRDANYRDAASGELLWRDGWLRTGDLGFITEDEYLQVTDQINDVIKTGGEWLSALELEDIITQHPAVNEAAVIGVPDEKWGEIPMALVVLRESWKDKVNEDELRDYFVQAADKGRIPGYAVPHTIHIVDVISKTSVGKLNKRNLRHQLGM